MHCCARGEKHDGSRKILGLPPFVPSGYACRDCLRALRIFAQCLSIVYASAIRCKGLTVLDTAGLDVESVTGMVGGSAQVVVFSTGLGTPNGEFRRAGHRGFAIRCSTPMI